MAQSSGLKKPIGIYLLAVLFILAPFGNILISFAGSGVENWYEPTVIGAFIQSIPLLDWIWLSLLVLTGILLFRPHKLSWSFAIFTLILVLLINTIRIYSMDDNSIDPNYMRIFSALALLCTLGVLIIAFYFRFPYLDRRSDWVKNIERYEYVIDAEVNGKKAKTESISVSGCRLQLDAPLDVRKGEVAKLNLPEISDETEDCVVVENTGRMLRLEFTGKSSQFNLKIKDWIRSKSS